MIETAPLQAYSSALLFAPTGSLVRKCFVTLIPDWVTQVRNTEEIWSRELWFTPSEYGGKALLSTDGRLVAWREAHGTMGIHDLRTGHDLPHVKHRDYLGGAEFSSDSKRIVTWSSFSSYPGARTTIRTHNLSTGDYTEWFIDDAATRQAMFTPSGDRVVTLSPLKGLIRMWTIDGKECPHQSSPKDMNSKDHFFCVVSPDLKSFAATNNGQIWVWDAETQMLQRRIRPSHRVLSIALADGGQLVAWIPPGQDGKWPVFILNLMNGAEEKTIEVASEPMTGRRAFAFSSTKLLAVGCRNNTMNLYNARTGQQIFVLRTFYTGLSSLALGPDGETAVSTNYGATRLWDLGGRNDTEDPRGGEREPEALGIDSLRQLEITPRHRNILSARYDIATRLGRKLDYQLAGKLALSMLPFKDSILSANFSPDRTFVVLFMIGETIQFWNGSMTEKLYDMGKISQPSIRISPDSKTTAISGERFGVSLVESWKWGNHRMLDSDNPRGDYRTLDRDNPNTTIAGYSLKFDPTSRLFVWAKKVRGEFSICTWRLNLYDLAHQTVKHVSARASSALDFLGSRGLLVYQGPGAGAEREVVDLATGRHQAYLPDERLFIASNDGYLAAISRPGDTITLWNLSTWKMMTEYRPCPNSAGGRETMALSPTGTVAILSEPANDGHGAPKAFQYWDCHLWDLNGENTGRFTLDGALTRNLRFSDCGQYLDLGGGRLPLPPATNPPKPDDYERGRDCLYCGYSWVYQGLRRILKLPTSYMNNSNYCHVDGKNGILVMRDMAGNLVVITIDLTKTPLSI